MSISETQIKNIQSILMKIWQKQVQLWYDTTDSNSTTPNDPVINPATDPSDPNPTSSSPDVNPPNSVPTIKRGHVLKLIPTGGVFCCRCGKQAKNQKHQILNKPCKFPDLEPSQWLTTPGFQQSQHRIHEAENLLNSQYNPGKHVLVWNRKLGKVKNKPDYGLLWCSACGRSWAWAQRMIILSVPLVIPQTHHQHLRIGLLFLNTMHLPLKKCNQIHISLRVLDAGLSENKSQTNQTHHMQVQLRPLQVLQLTDLQNRLVLASDDVPCAWGVQAACLHAPSSHYYFWDPAGTPAPTMSTSTCVPEVRMYSEVCPRMSCVKHTFTYLRDGLEEFLVI